MPWINLSEHWTTLPPFIQEQTSQVSRFWGQSHGLTMRHKNLTVNRFTSQWNTLIEYFHFTSKKWFSWINYVEIHSSQAYSSLFVIFDHLVDKINAKQGYCYQFVAFRYVSYTMSKWWERQRQCSKQNGKVRILLNIFLAIHFHFYVFPTPGFSSFWCRW